jgi:hypothetical protein
MRWLVLTAALAGLLGCTEQDPDPLYVEINYQLRCLDCVPRANDYPEHHVMHLNGDDGHTARCDTLRRDSDTLVSFGVTYVDRGNEDRSYSLAVNQAGLDGAEHGPPCAVTIGEGVNTFEGACAEDETTAERPCAVDLERDGDIVRGTLYCDKVSIKGMTTFIRYLTAPAPSQDPAGIEIHGCSF